KINSVPLNFFLQISCLLLLAFPPSSSLPSFIRHVVMPLLSIRYAFAFFVASTNEMTASILCIPQEVNTYRTSSINSLSDTTNLQRR
ncbi:MAG: hypothetical protein ACI90V_014253, partial [Bacillariaceae sp.]